MANGKSYGIQFPFALPNKGTYVEITETADAEIRTDLIHLLLTRKGSRYYLPDFGTRLYEYLFEPLDGPTFSSIEAEIRESVNQYMPNLKLTNITITTADDNDLNAGDTANSNTFLVPGPGVPEYTAKIRIDYQNTNNTFATSDFVVLVL
jgi:phage baseplate assembly protein W